MDVAGPNSLIRLLRSPQDPPSQGGPSKIAIASRVWNDSSDIPGKANIIRDWIYSVWEKDGKHTTAASTFDHAHLDLLASILSFTSQALPSHLLALYFRAQSQSASRLSAGSHELWIDGVRRCIASSDAWVEVWVEMIKWLSEDGSAADWDLVHVVESKVGESIALMPISKKNSLAVQNSQVDISKAFAQHTQLDSDILGSIIYPASSLRISKSLFSTLESLPSTTSTLRFVPRLLCALESSVRNNRYDLFVQPTSSKTPYQTYTNEKVRSFLCTAVGEAQALLSSMNAGLPEFELWKCRHDIWQDVTKWGIYVESDQKWRNLLSHDISKAKALMEGRPGMETVGAILAFMTIAEELDHIATDVGVNIMAWCLAAPTSISTEAEGVLSATFRYHRLSQSPEIWITLLLASVDQLLAASGSSDAQSSLHKSIIRGPLFSDGIWQQLNTMRRTEEIVERLLTRLQVISNLDLSSAITVDIISHLAIALCADNQRPITPFITTLEALLLSVKQKRRDSAFELSLAALVRLGRIGGPATRARLDHEFAFASSTRKASSAGLREETCQWLVTRIGDAPEQTGELVDSLVVAVQHVVTESCWNALDREGLSALEHSATTEQLNNIFAARAGHELEWLLSSAETIEMPRVLNAMLKATLTRMSEEEVSGSTFSLLASLPSTVMDETSRQAVLRRAQAADALANPETSCTIRQALTYLVEGSSVKVDLSYWSELQKDADVISETNLQACTRSLLRAFIKLAFDSEIELDRLLDGLSNDTTRTLVVDVAVGHDAARVPAKLKSRLGQLVDEMTTVQTQSTPAQTLLAIRKLRHWCDGTVVGPTYPLQLAKCHSLGPAELELLRLQCEDGPSLLAFLHLLMSRSDLISSELLQKEVLELAGQTDDLERTIQACLGWIFAQNENKREGGFAVLVELLSIRRQGSGKAVLRCRESLLDCLLLVPTAGIMSSAQLRAIKAFVRLRSKLLRVSDITRIIVTLSPSPKATAIDIVHAAVLTRSDLVVHVLPVLARFLCSSFDAIDETSAISLSRLLSTFGTRRSARSNRDAPLSLPFSKHAPAVLVSYVRSVTRPHNTLSIATRRTLQMSVYTICDGVIRSQDRGREGEGIGTPYGLGETGEAEQEIWADLWKQWAKQRYKGQG